LENMRTDELLTMLFMKSGLERLMEMDDGQELLPAFSDYITGLCRGNREPPERVIRRANIERSYGHQLFSGRRSPSRDTVLQLAFGFGMDYTGTQQLLKVARKSALHPRVKRDMVLVYSLAHGLTLMDCQLLLQKYRLPLLGEGNRNA